MFGSGIDSVQVKEPMIQLYPSELMILKLKERLYLQVMGSRRTNTNTMTLKISILKGRILLLMNRAPLSADGTRYLFEEPIWRSLHEHTGKATTLLFSRAKAILIVSDPKSGFSSVEQQYPGIANELGSNKYLKGSKPLILICLPCQESSLSTGRLRMKY